MSENVWVHKTATVYPSAYLGAPCIIGPNTEVRHCAFIRGSALVGADCVVGNSVELKNVILFDHVQTPHYNYVGDSILGYYSHMGAGSITSNVKSDKKLVVVHNGTESIETGVKKFGAMLGDHVEAFNDDLSLLGRYCEHLALLAFILAGDDNNCVACFNMYLVHSNDTS